ncbi:MAG: hypothetical protein HOK52_14725 [Candidatus Marinimicrobia bacterium]|jgi:hypothetical protein|nr:hypothetical protein [Candidatus Neomarinimicrobiota bacterium]
MTELTKDQIKLTAFDYGVAIEIVEALSNTVSTIEELNEAVEDAIDNEWQENNY